MEASLLERKIEIGKKNCDGMYVYISLTLTKIASVLIP